MLRDLMAGSPEDYDTTTRPMLEAIIESPQTDATEYAAVLETLSHGMSGVSAEGQDKAVLFLLKEAAKQTDAAKCKTLLDSAQWAIGHVDVSLRGLPKSEDKIAKANRMEANYARVLAENIESTKDNGLRSYMRFLIQYVNALSKPPGPPPR
jgi:hypothetical protein